MSDQDAESRKDRVVLLGANLAFGQEIRLQLKHFAYLVEQVSASDVARLSDDTRIRAMLLDVPAEAGTDLGVTRRVRDRLAASSIPLIVLSKCDDMAPRLAAVRMGAVAYLLKPLDYALLVDTLDQVTGRRYPEPYRVLVVGQGVEQAERCKTAMEAAGMEVVTLQDPMKTLAVMAEFNPELVLMELHLSGLCGVELAAVIRQKQSYLSVPIVFLSNETPMERQIEAMKQGDNFLTKPIPSEYLVAAVATRAERYRMLRALMTRDSLTGLLNHINSKERLAIEVRRAIRVGGNLVVAMIDIDRFKLVNDTLGHQAGDQVIKRLARLLRQRLRRTDVMGRYGGDEFLVVLVDTSLEAGKRVLEHVRRDFASLGQHRDSGGLGVTFSAGLASLADHPDPGLLLEAADKALYRAKRQGGDRIVVEDRSQSDST